MNPLRVRRSSSQFVRYADMQALGAQEIAGIGDRYTPTISLTVDFIAPAKLGDWVQMRIELLRATQSLLFSQGLVSANDHLVARSSAIYKVGRSRHPDRDATTSLFKTPSADLDCGVGTFGNLP